MDEIEHLLSVVRAPDATADTAEERLGLMEDRWAVRDLLHRYGYLCDAGAWDELLECYTDDIERTLGGTLSEYVVGKEVLRERYFTPAFGSSTGTELADAAQLQPYVFRHMIIGDLIRIDPNRTRATAAARGQLSATADDADGHRRGVHDASYVFHFRKESGTWKIEKLWVYSQGAHNPLFGKAST